MKQILSVVLVAWARLAVDRSHSVGSKMASSIADDPLPPWRFAEMAEVVVRQGDWVPKEVEAIELLAWFSQVDDRPIYVDNAIFGLRLTGKRWALAHLVRNPLHGKPTREKAREAKWQFGYVFDVDWSSMPMFDHRPTASDLELFLWYWRFNYFDEGWKVLGAGVRTHAWEKFLGGPVPLALDPPIRSESSDPVPLKERAR